MYVGSGLLGGILLLLPIRGILAVSGTGPARPPASDAAQPWVYTVVYGAFAVLGVCLGLLFALHAWERWVRPIWRMRLADLPSAPARARRVGLAHGVFMVGICLTTAALASTSTGLGVGGHDVLAVLAALLCLGGLTLLARRRPGPWPAWIPMALAWVGSAIVASWGLFFTVMFAVPNPLVGEASPPGGPRRRRGHASRQGRAHPVGDPRPAPRRHSWRSIRRCPKGW